MMVDRKKAQLALDEMRNIKSGQTGNVIAADAEIGGACKFNGPTSLAARVTGDVTCDSLLVVESGGAIVGNVTAPIIIVHGEINGEVKAPEGLQATKGASLTGTVIAPSVEIDQGARVSADLKISPTAANEDALPAPKLAAS